MSFKISDTTRVRPAYGRKYATAEAAAAAWSAGSDFKMVGGPYCSNRDFVEGTIIHIFYDMYDFTTVIVGA